MKTIFLLIGLMILSQIYSALMQIDGNEAIYTIGYAFLIAIISIELYKSVFSPQKTKDEPDYKQLYFQSNATVKGLKKQLEENIVGINPDINNFSDQWKNEASRLRAKVIEQQTEIKKLNDQVNGYRGKIKQITNGKTEGISANSNKSVYYPLLVSTLEYKKFIAIQSTPEVKYWIKDKELTEEEFILLLDKSLQ